MTSSNPESNITCQKIAIKKVTVFDWLIKHAENTILIWITRLKEIKKKTLQANSL